MVYPLANLLASGQVELGDTLCIDWDGAGERLIFQNQGSAPPALIPQQPVAPAFAATRNGMVREAIAGASAHRIANES
jgi:hypothetical protein